MKLTKWTGLHLMIYITTFWGSIYELFAGNCRAKQEQLLNHVCSPSKLKKRDSGKRQKLLNKITPKGIQVLLALRKHARRHNLLLLAIYASVSVRYYLTRLVSINWFRDYHLLDCFIMGRIRMIGRMYLMGPLAASIFEALFFYYRLKISYGTPSGFQFNVFEFLLHDYDEVLANEIAHHAQPHWRPHSPNPIEDANQQAQRQEVAQEVANFRRKTSSLPGSVGDHLLRGRNLGGHSQRGASMGGRASPPPSLIAQRHDPLFYARNSLRDDDIIEDKFFCSMEPEWILRPNRTSASWRIMAKLTVLFFWMSLTGILTNFIFVTLIMLPPTVTPMGFEIYYPACVRWLQRHQQAELAKFNLTNHKLVGDRVLAIDSGHDFRLNYSGIHLAVGRDLACDRPISQVPVIQLFSDDPEILPWTLYQTWRFIIDSAQTYIFYIDFGFVFCAHLYILAMMSIDVVLNTLDIRKRLVKLLDELLQSCHHDHAERIENKQVYAHLEVPDQLISDFSILHENLNRRPSPWQVHKGREHEQLNEHIITLQSLLIDHFSLVRGYNQYVSNYLFMLLITLFAFSGAFTVLIFTLKNKAIELEFLICELLSIIFIIPLFAGPCITHIYNVQLNSLISRAMALDSTDSLTKFRWIILMNHYKPMPLYCFTLFERTPVSWLFFVKLVSWFFSAGFVVANFLYVYKHPE